MSPQSPESQSGVIGKWRKPGQRDFRLAWNYWIWEEYRALRGARLCILLFLFMTIGLALAYFVKVKLHINLSKSLSLTEYFPLLSRIEPTNIEQTTVGTLIEDNFEPTLTGSLHWANFWSRESNRVEMRLIKDETQGSHALLIASDTDRDWSYVGFYHYRVNPGEVFRLKIDARYGGAQRLALIMDAYGPDRKIIRWGYRELPLDRPGGWQTYETEFEIDALPAYIKIRLEGRGRGQSRFDNLRVDRLK